MNTPVILVKRSNRAIHGLLLQGGRCVKVYDDYNGFDAIVIQAKLLADWNIRHIDDEPEQVRKNVETLCSVFATVHLV